jgi:hypothetical protein
MLLVGATEIEEEEEEEEEAENMDYSKLPSSAQWS